MNQSNKNTASKKWIQIFIESILGQPFQIFAAPYENVLNLKERIEYVKGISTSQQRLIWQSTELHDDLTVEDLKLQDGAKLTLLPAMRGGPLNYRRVELKDSFNPEFLKKLSELTSEETNSGKPPVVVMVVHDGQLLNFFHLRDSDASLDSLSASFLEIEEDLEEESDDEKQKKEENEQLHQKVTALRKKMDSIAIDKSNVNLPKPVPPPLNRENNIRKISQATSAKPSVRVTKQPNQPPNGTSVALHSTVANPLVSNNLAAALLKQKGADASSRGSVFRKSQNLQHNDHRKSSIVSNHNGTASSTRCGGSLPQIRTQRSLPIKVRRLSLPGKNSKQREGYDGPTCRKRNSVPSEDIEVPPGLNSSSYKALNNYLMLAETFPGGARYRQPLETVTSQVTSTTHGPLKPPATSNPQQSLATGTSVDKNTVTRCAVCSKKTGLATTFECRCLKKFCAVHRNPEAHSCSYDYKGEGRKELKESNPVIVAQKLPKI